VLALLAVGCSSGEDPPGTAPEIWCQGLCGAVVRCGLHSSRYLCEEDCVEERPGLVTFSVSGARALEPCLSAFDCEALTSEPSWDAAWDACWDQAQERVEVSPRARTLCVAYAAAWFECGSWWSVADCEQNYSMFRGEAVEQSFACIDEPDCDALVACSNAVFEAL